MKKLQIFAIIVFVSATAALLWYGSQYSEKISRESRETRQRLADEAEQAQLKIMENFKIREVIVGNGAEARNGDAVTVNYTGTLDDGKKFDSSYDRSEPFLFKLGAGDVIKGWDLGVAGMKVGGKRELTIPPELGYGPAGYPPVIPQNATLHFTVELLSVSSSASR